MPSAAQTIQLRTIIGCRASTWATIWLTVALLIVRSATTPTAMAIYRLPHCIALSVAGIAVGVLGSHQHETQAKTNSLPE